MQMSRIIKHVGTHNGKKIIVVFRKVPNEDHMCLVAYTETLNVTYHDAILSALESEEGQQATDLADVLFRKLLPDGRGMLQTMHGEHLIKKVPCNQVMLTPNSKTKVRLDEVNEIMDKMAQGGDAAKKLAELEANTGMRDTKNPAKRSDPRRAIELPANVTENQVAARNVAGPNDVLSDEDLANNLLLQSESLRANAERLLAESVRLADEAKQYSAKKTVSISGKKKPARVKKVKA
jgi:hypothetical protein